MLWRVRIRRSLQAIGLFGVSLSGAAHQSYAGDACAALDVLVESVLTGVAASSDAKPEPFLGNAEACGQSQSLSGARSLHCQWSYGYRDPVALTMFQSLISGFESCDRKDATAVQDLDVNHPDSYDLRTFLQNGRTIAISLKDKATLQKTYIFVRVEDVR